MNWLKDVLKQLLILLFPEHVWQNMIPAEMKNYKFAGYVSISPGTNLKCKHEKYDKRNVPQWIAVIVSVTI